MRKVSEYRQHAKECRGLAKQSRSAEHRQMLLNMAVHMGIARQRSYQDRRRPGANCQVGKSRREEP